MIPSDKIVISDLKSNELFYNELIKIVNKYTQIPPKLLSIMVGNKKDQRSNVCHRPPAKSNNK